MKKIAFLLFLFLVGCSQHQQNTGGDNTHNTGNLSVKDRPVTVYTTAKNTDYRLSVTDTLNFKPTGQPEESNAYIFIDPSHKFQTIIGFGGAITDAAAETFYKLPKDERQEILQAYYDPQKGIGYTLARTQINSCDFSRESYTYVAKNDTALKTFDVKHDEQYRIPLIKAANQETGGHLTIYASPWSPPAWMKDNGSMLHGGHLKPEFYQAWANYFGKFIKAYKKHGVNIWGVTVQNEPLAAQTWESCIFTAKQERDFVQSALGPAFHKAGLSNKKIIIWDHNRGLMYQYASTILNDPKAAKYVWGVGFHWYVHDNFQNVRRVHKAFPKTHLLFTEGTTFPFDTSKIHQWKWGEKYGKSMVHDLNNGAVGWTDWNILLNQHGGPNHVQNFCYAPIIGNTKTGKLTYMNSYYYIGQFSKFIHPGARRITSSTNRGYKLQTTAFINPSGTIAVVVLNLTDQKIPYHLWVKGEAAPETSLPHSIQTLVF